MKKRSLTKAIFIIIWFLIKWAFLITLCCTPIGWVLIPYLIISFFYRPESDKGGLPDQELRAGGQIMGAFKQRGAQL